MSKRHRSRRRELTPQERKARRADRALMGTIVALVLLGAAMIFWWPVPADAAAARWQDCVGRPCAFQAQAPPTHTRTARSPELIPRGTLMQLTVRIEGRRVVRQEVFPSSCRVGRAYLGVVIRLRTCPEPRESFYRLRLRVTNWGYTRGRVRVGYRVVGGVL